MCDLVGKAHGAMGLSRQHLETESSAVIGVECAFSNTKTGVFGITLQNPASYMGKKRDPLYINCTVLYAMCIFHTISAEVMGIYLLFGAFFAIAH